MISGERSTPPLKEHSRQIPLTLHVVLVALSPSAHRLVRTRGDDTPRLVGGIEVGFRAVSWADDWRSQLSMLSINSLRAATQVQGLD